MDPRPELLPCYLELLEGATLGRQAAQRAAFALLAADAYLASGQEDEGEELFRLFVAEHPDHVLARHPSLASAVHDPEAERYLADLRRNYPEDVVRKMVNELRAKPSLIPRPLQPEPVRQSPPPNRGPGNPVPGPRPMPTVPPRKDPVPLPVPAPVKPRPATVPTPQPNHPGQQKQSRPKPTPIQPPPTDPDEPGVPVVQLLLMIVLVGAGLAMVGWTLVRPFWHSTPGGGR